MRGMDDLSNVPPLLSSQALTDALRGVDDPELGINIVDLGLVVDVRVEPGRVEVDLAMTSPSCPMGDLLVADSTDALRAVLPGTIAVIVRLVDEPVWTPERMSPAARLQFDW